MAGDHQMGMALGQVPLRYKKFHPSFDPAMVGLDGRVGVKANVSPFGPGASQAAQQMPISTAYLHHRGPSRQNL
jgi:hypothetical protein